jgi:hypothetical protein
VDGESSTVSACTNDDIGRLQKRNTTKSESRVVAKLVTRAWRFQRPMDGPVYLNILMEGDYRFKSIFDFKMLKRFDSDLGVNLVRRNFQNRNIAANLRITSCTAKASSVLTFVVALETIIITTDSKKKFIYL